MKKELDEARAKNVELQKDLDKMTTQKSYVTDAFEAGRKEMAKYKSEASLAAEEIARLRAAIEALNLRDVDSRLSLSVSFGVAEWQGEAATDLLRRADRALYAAKNAGRNRVERAAPGSAAPLDTLGGAGLAP